MNGGDGKEFNSKNDQLPKTQQLIHFLSNTFLQKDLVLGCKAEPSILK